MLCLLQIELSCLALHEQADIDVVDKCTWKGPTDLSRVSTTELQEREFCDRETVQTPLQYCQLFALSTDDLRRRWTCSCTNKLVDGGSVLFIQQHRVGV